MPDVVDTSVSGSSVSYIVAGSGVDTFSSFCEVVEGGKPVSCAVVGTNDDGISGSTDAVEISIEGFSVSYIDTGPDVDNSSSLRDIVE